MSITLAEASVLADKTLAPLRNPKEASKWDLDQARIMLNAWQKAGMLNPDWQKNGVKLHPPKSSSETSPSPESKSRQGPNGE